MIIPLSYPLTRKTPLYPNTPAPVINQLRSIEGGDSANTCTITLANHSGTHIDAPSHFHKSGKTISEFLTGDTLFSHAYCIDLPSPSSREIGISDLEIPISSLKNADAILIKTGWHSIRLEDPDRYCHDHPWISPELPQFLKEKCPHLRLFGIDQISVSSVLHRDAGRECHRSFLDGKNSILLLEDINLSEIGVVGSFRLHIFPLMIDEIDGVPVIAVADI